MIVESFRIGNVVSWRGSWVRVIGVLADGIMLADGRIGRCWSDKLKPIELTEKVFKMVRCGERVKDMFRRNEIEGCYEFEIRSGRRKVWYLHEMQNIVYWCSGSELEI